MTEREKMTAGELYFPGDPELVEMRKKAHRLCTQYNQTFETDEETRKIILTDLLANYDDDEMYFQGGIFFDYGKNIFIGKNFYANYNLTILDVCPVTIGDNVMLGTGVSLLTPLHPLNFVERNKLLESGKPISIGNNCWLASNVTVLPGVKIGDGCVIGTGSVVTKDIPSNSFAAGNPCRVIKNIE